jgi:3-oxoacyl-[acyl-carrier protein] reductase
MSPEISSIDPALLSFVPCDLMTVDFASFTMTLREQFHIFGLVNNAGIGSSGILSMMPDAQIAQVMRMNVTAPITLTKYLVRSMLVAREGRVVNISSIVAGTGYSGLSAYSASKAAIEGFTRSLAREVGTVGITVNAVAPGFVDTEMTHGLTDRQRQHIARRSALNRFPTTNDVGNAVVFLMSDLAANITGTVMTIDAGNSA